MPRNRRRDRSSIQVGTMAKASVALVMLGVIGLSWVFMKVQLNSTCVKIQDLEQELKELQTQNKVLNTQVTSLSAHPALKRHLEQGLIEMQQISNDRIVRWNSAMARLALDEVRPVANQGGVQ